MIYIHVIYIRICDNPDQPSPHECKIEGKAIVYFRKSVQADYRLAMERKIGLFRPYEPQNLDVLDAPSVTSGGRSSAYRDTFDPEFGNDENLSLRKPLFEVLQARISNTVLRMRTSPTRSNTYIKVYLFRARETHLKLKLRRQSQVSIDRMAKFGSNLDRFRLYQIRFTITVQSRFVKLQEPNHFNAHLTDVSTAAYAVLQRKTC